MRVTPTKALRFRRFVIELIGLYGAIMMMAVLLAYRMSYGPVGVIPPVGHMNWYRLIVATVVGTVAILCSGIAAGWPIDCDGKHCECRSAKCCWCDGPKI
jgi:hypothetical protein